MIQVRKDEVKHLQRVGLGKYAVAKTCHGKKFAEEKDKDLEEEEQENEKEDELDFSFDDDESEVKY